MLDGLGSRTLIMGVLNVTPDSFYDGGRYNGAEKAFGRARELHEEGADIIDVGGESSRPGATPVSAQEEADRVCPVIERIACEMPVPVSVDTRKPSVADAAIRAGASIVNDISALGSDGSMGAVAARSGVHIVLMHMRGEPGNMQENPVYVDCVGEIYQYLCERAAAARAMGIDRDRIIIDPGIGFGKTLEHNYELLRNVGYFKKSGFPVLVGVSRKSLIGRLYAHDEDRLPATIALNTAAAMFGADIVRVHDVREHKLALQAVDMLKKARVADGICN
jgi:dihydropteroate synthase